MRLLDKLRMRGHTLFGRRTADVELENELRFHLEEQIAENRAAGMNEIEARQAAMRLFGNPAVVREHARADVLERNFRELERQARSQVRLLRWQERAEEQARL